MPQTYRSYTSGQIAQIKSAAAAAAVAELNAGLSRVVEDLLNTQRVSRLPKTSAQAWTLGQNIYWDGSLATTDSAAGPKIGTAGAPAANPSTHGYVALVGARTTLADVLTANATDGATAATLANDLKSRFNDLLAELRG